jgi:hypothetical protein
MSSEEPWLSPSAEKAARNDTRRALRTRQHEIVNALRADWDESDADTFNLLSAALTADGESRLTPWLLFGLASRAISELADATGTTREEWLTRLLR